jgi:hypothetical protein
MRKFWLSLSKAGKKKLYGRGHTGTTEEEMFALISSRVLPFGIR